MNWQICPVHSTLPWKPLLFLHLITGRGLWSLTSFWLCSLDQSWTKENLSAVTLELGLACLLQSSTRETYKLGVRHLPPSSYLQVRWGPGNGMTSSLQSCLPSGPWPQFWRDWTLLPTLGFAKISQCPYELSSQEVLSPSWGYTYFFSTSHAGLRHRQGWWWKERRKKTH